MLSIVWNLIFFTQQIYCSVGNQWEVTCVNKKGIPEKRVVFLETCFDLFCEKGLENTGLKMLADACGVSNANLLYYFGDKDNIIIEATAHCMAKVEDDFMANAPKDFEDVERFLREMPYLTAKLHGKKYRFMYQVYSSPKYREYGKEFFAGVTKRYTEYAKSLEPTLGIPWQTLQPLIYMFVRACVHYALFEDEDYLKPQIALIGEMLPLITEKYAVK